MDILLNIFKETWYVWFFATAAVFVFYFFAEKSVSTKASAVILVLYVMNSTNFKSISNLGAVYGWAYILASAFLSWIVAKFFSFFVSKLATTFMDKLGKKMPTWLLISIIFSTLFF